MLYVRLWVPVLSLELVYWLWWRIYHHYAFIWHGDSILYNLQNCISNKNKENAQIWTARSTLNFEVLKWCKTDLANISKYLFNILIDRQKKYGVYVKCFYFFALIVTNKEKLQLCMWYVVWRCSYEHTGSLCMWYVVWRCSYEHTGSLCMNYCL